MRTRLILASLTLLYLSGRQRTSDLSVSVGPECAIAILGSSVQRFDSGAGTEFRGLTRFRIKARTSRTGRGEILLRFQTSDILGPSTFSFATRPGSVGAPATGLAKDPATLTTVAAIGQNRHTDRAGEVGSVEWNYMTEGAAPSAVPPAPQMFVTCH